MKYFILKHFLFSFKKRLQMPQTPEYFAEENKNKKAKRQLIMTESSQGLAK